MKNHREQAREWQLNLHKGVTHLVHKQNFPKNQHFVPTDMRIIEYEKSVFRKIMLRHYKDEIKVEKLDLTLLHLNFSWI